MTRLYTNENIALGVVARLRELGHDVLTSHDAGRANQRIPDEKVLRDATGEDRALITHNYTDFRDIHRDGAVHAGIIAPTVDTDFTALATRIDEVLAQENPLPEKLVRVTKGGHSLIPRS